MKWWRHTEPAPINKPVVYVREQVSTHFYWREFFVSKTYQHLADELPYLIPQRGVYGLIWLSQTILEPVRQQFDRPLIISSGFRSVELNGLVNGVHDSQHLYGEAVDFIVDGVKLADVYTWIKENLYYSIGVVKMYDTWIHISLPTNEKRSLFIDARG